MSQTDTPPLDDSTEVLEPDWLAAPAHRSRSRVALLVALAVLLVFLGGVEVQKRWGTDAGASTSGRFTGAPAGGGALPAGGFGALPSGGTGRATSQNDTGSATTPTPAVIGTLVRLNGHAWTVKDLGGTSHTVEVSSATTVTRRLADTGRPLRAGSSVTVVGATHGTTVTATSVTVR